MTALAQLGQFYDVLATLYHRHVGPSSQIKGGYGHLKIFKYLVKSLCEHII